MSFESGQVFTGPSNNGSKRRRGWGVTSLPAVRRRIGRILADLEHGRIDVQMGRAMFYGLSILAGILRTEAELSIEERLTRLEEQVLNR